MVCCVGVGGTPGLTRPSFTISVRFSYFAETSSPIERSVRSQSCWSASARSYRLLVVVAVLQQPSELEGLRVGREDRVVHPVDVLARVAALAIRRLLARLLRRLRLTEVRLHLGDARRPVEDDVAEHLGPRQAVGELLRVLERVDPGSAP